MARNVEGRRKTKGDLKRKRLNRGYKRGGKFRTHNVGQVDDGDFDGSALSEGNDLPKKNKSKYKKSRK